MSLLKNSFYLYIRTFLTMLIGMYSSRVILQTLGAEDYGLYNVVGGIVALFSFLQSGLTSATSRFLTIDLGTNNLIKLKSTFSSSLSLHILIGILLIIIFETIGLVLFSQLNIPDAKFKVCQIVYQISVLSTVISFIITPFNALIIAHEKMTFYAYVGILDVILKLVILYLLVYLPFDKLLVYSLLLFGTTLIYIFINVGYCFINFQEVSWKITICKKNFKSLLTFTGWTMIGSISYLTSTQGINYLLNISCGAYINAARAIALQLQSVISRFIQGFQTAINPQITKSYSKSEYIEMQELIFKSSRYSFYVLSIIIFPICFYLPQILHLWLGKIPDYTVIFSEIMILSAFIEALDNPLRTALNATGSIRNIQIISSILYFLSTLLSTISLYLKFPPQYVFIIVSLLTLMIIPFRLYYLNHLINMNIKLYFSHVVKYILVISFFCFFLQQIAKFIENYFIGIIVTASLLISTIYMVLKKEEKLFIKTKIKGIYGRL